MAEENIYDEIEIEVRASHPPLPSDPNQHFSDSELQDMAFDSTLQIYHYPCPCGDRFEIGIEDLRDGEEIAVCPSCSLMIRVVFEVESLPKTEELQQTVQQQVVVG